MARSKIGKRHPICSNDLQARRRRLKLSRVALARILDVDPATVFRQERGVMSAQWDYAMQGIEAEAQRAKPILQNHQGQLRILEISSRTPWSNGATAATATPAKK